MSYPDMLAAFDGGSIDAAAFVEPFTTVTVEQGLAVKLIDAADLLPGMNLAVLMYGERLLTEDRDLGERFMRAFHRANAAMRELAAPPEGVEPIAPISQEIGRASGRG